MREAGIEGEYAIYKAPLISNIRIPKGEYQISLLLVHQDQLTSIKVGTINLSFDNFSAINKLQFMEEVSRDVKLACKKIEEYTQLNIQLYNDIKEATGK